MPKSMKLGISKEIPHKRAVGLVVPDEGGRILIMQNLKLGLFSILTGKVEKGHAISRALKDEAKQELGIKLLKYKKITESIGIYNVDGIETKITTEIFIALSRQDPIINAEPQKHPWIGYLNPDTMKDTSQLSDATKAYLRRHKYKDEINKLKLEFLKLTNSALINLQK